jgi:hypothetical protein
MNKLYLLGGMINAVDEQIRKADQQLLEQSGGSGPTLDSYVPTSEDLKSRLLELYSRREDACVYPPESLPTTAEEMIPVLRQMYKDDVTKISLILHHYFPEQYLYYRVGTLEPEIAKGFDFFSDTVEEFRFDFGRARRTGFDDYLARNSTLLEVGRIWWPDVHNLQARINLFLYNHLAEMFRDASDYNCYWICGTQHDYWQNRHSNAEQDEDETDVIRWSGSKYMQENDLVFMYCSAPVKAITDIYYVSEPPQFEPYGAWDGIYVQLAHMLELPNPIPFATMRNDPVLGQWSVIRRQFQGVVTESVPHSCYNRLLSYMPDEVKDECELTPEPVSDFTVSGSFGSEEEFEDAIIEPMLKRWGLHYKRQMPCKCHFGTQQITGFIDFLVSNATGALTLIENKLKIVSDEGLRKAVNQGKSYALMLGLPSFVVASPEGCKLYSLERNKETLVDQLSPQAEKADEERFLSSLMKLQAGRHK